MISLDMRTVLLSYVVSNFLCMAVMARLWLSHRRRFEGTGYWLADFVLQFAALLLVALRGRIPDIISMTGANVLVLGGTIVLYRGLERFVDRRGSQAHNYALLLVFALVHGYFSVVKPLLYVRNIILSVGMVLICAQCAYLMIVRVGPTLRPMAAGVGYVMAGFSAASLLRIFLDLREPQAEQLFSSYLHDTALVLGFQMLYIVLTFSLFMMINRRLFRELEEDILARRLAEEDLRASREKFELAFNSSPEAILLTRMSDGRIVEVNEGFCQLTGYVRQEVLQKTALDLGLWPTPEDRQALMDALCKGTVRHREIHFIGKGGRILHCLYSGGVIELATVPHVVSVVEDVTERRKAESELRRANEMFSLFMKHTPIFAFIKEVSEKDRLSRVLLASENYVDMIGLPGSLMTGKSMAELFPPEFAAKITEDDIAVVTKGEVLKLDEDLGGRNYTTIKFPFKVGGRRLLAGYTIDITERKHAAEALRQSEERFRTLMDALEALVYVADMQSHEVLFLNKYGTALYGEPGGLPCWRLLHKGQEGPCSFCTNRLLLDAEGNPREAQEWQYREASTARWYSVRDKALRWTDGRLVHMGVATDITRIKEIEAQLKAMNEAKTMLMREIHHRVKNNLAVIQSLLSLHARNVQEQAGRTAFLEAQGRINSMSMIYERLQGSEDLKSIGSSEYIYSLAETLFKTYRTGQEGIKASYALQDHRLDVDTMVPLGLILNELLTNSLKHAFKAGQGGELHVALLGLGEGRYELSVHDTGPGMPEGFDIKATRSLGLRIVNSLVEQIGGELEISKSGTGGAVFTVRFGPQSAAGG